MTAERVLRYEAPDAASLERIAGSPAPGLRAGGVRRDFLREIFFDTTTGELEDRGVIVRIRVVPDGTRTLTVDIRENGDDGTIIRKHADERVVGDDYSEILTGPSEPGRLLAAIIDPERLAPVLEIELTRYTREFWMEQGDEPKLVVRADAMTARRGDLSIQLFDVELELPDQEVGQVDGLIEALVQAFDLRQTPASRFARAREALARAELRMLEDQVRSARRSAVVVRRGGAIGLIEAGSELRIPSGRGWGEESAREVLRATFGDSRGQLRVLGTSAGTGRRAAVEVWLAERTPEAEPEPAANGASDPAPPIRWVALDGIVPLVGTPALRDATTLAALHMALRQGLQADTVPSWSQRPISREDHLFRPETAAILGRPDGAEPEPSTAGPDPRLLINMETSELAFNERVLALAEDPRTPVLERARFLSILGSNLDQFFMTRVAGFHQQVATGSTKCTLDGMTPEEQLDVIAVRVREIYARAYDFLHEHLIPALEEQGISIARYEDLEESDREYLGENYGSVLGAMLMPLTADPRHPFPHIRNLRPHLGVIVRVPATGAEHFAVIELPGDLPRFVPLPGGRRFVPLEDIVTSTLPSLYSGLEVVQAHTFRVTRSGNLSLEEDVGDVLQAVAEKVRRRPLGPVVRLEVEESMPAELRETLLRELLFETRDRAGTLREEDVYPVRRFIDLFSFDELASLPFPDLHYPPFHRGSPLDPGRSIFEQLRDGEVLVRFPQHSFEGTVERLLTEAVKDPEVVSIRITLYRTNRSSRVVRLLRKARRRGKDVIALIELKASFDERRNIEWARSLEAGGIHVMFGPPHLKVHAKTALVVRREGDDLRRYAFVGTGNLNAATSASYTDLGLLTADPEITGEVQEVFNGLTGYSITTEYDHLLVAPFNMRQRFLEMIDREIAHAAAGREGLVRVKLNGLTDRELIDALYRASQAGVKVEMVVRGMCSLRPGVPGISENISVVSVLGRFLEHGRIYRFGNAGAPEYYIGSADWRPRNLSRRVEVAAPVRDPQHQAEIDRLLEGDLKNPNAWDLQPDGTYRWRGGPRARRARA